MTEPARHRLLLFAILVSVFTIAWNVVFGGLAIAVAIATRSPSLAGFGLDAVVDAAASGVLVWHFTTARQDEDRARRLEAVVIRSVGAALVVAAVYIATRSIVLLLQGSVPEDSAIGIAIAGASVLVLPVLAFAKLRIARRLQSKALRSDGILTAGAALLAALALVAVSLRSVDGLWWVDSAAALVIAMLLAAEGARALLTSRA